MFYYILLYYIAVLKPKVIFDLVKEITFIDIQLNNAFNIIN